MTKKRVEKNLLLGYIILAVLLAVDFLIFYKFIFATGNVALSIDLAGNNNSTNLKMAGFVTSIIILSYLVYHYFLKNEINL